MPAKLKDYVLYNASVGDCFWKVFVGRPKIQDGRYPGQQENYSKLSWFDIVNPHHSHLQLDGTSCILSQLNDYISYATFPQLHKYFLSVITTHVELRIMRRCQGPAMS